MGFDERFVGVSTDGVMGHPSVTVVDDSGIETMSYIRNRMQPENMLYLLFQSASLDINKTFLDVTQDGYSVGEQLQDVDGTDIWEAWGSEVLRGCVNFFTQ